MFPAGKTPGTLVIQRGVPPEVASLGEADAELLEHAGALGSQEAHGDENPLAGRE
jgi:hypothetical protein